LRATTATTLALLNVAATFALNASVTLSGLESGNLALPWPFTVVESNHRYNRPTSRSVGSPKDKSPEDQGFAPINYFKDNFFTKLDAPIRNSATYFKGTLSSF